MNIVKRLGDQFAVIKKMPKPEQGQTDFHGCICQKFNLGYRT